MAFDKFAHEAGLDAVTFNGDAFSHEMRKNVIDTLNKMGRKVDLLVYSVASSVRVDPDNGTLYRSVLKPIGETFTGATIDCMTGAISTISAEPATEEEAANSVKVMGGEDWARFTATVPSVVPRSTWKRLPRNSMRNSRRN